MVAEEPEPTIILEPVPETVQVELPQLFTVAALVILNT